jgi:5-methylcytosine-specific restriction endonuclease McrA
LPPPDSPELQSLLRNRTTRELYRLLYESRNNPPTMLEIRDRLRDVVGDQEQLDRRRRDLNPHFVIERVGRGTHTRYKLVGRRTSTERTARVSAKTRAFVLSAGRCAYCGSTPTDDRVHLHVDHRIPQSWGGSSDVENLQALCDECNQGKKNLFSDFDEHAAAIRMALRESEPQKRIGELLKAFGGEWVPSLLLGIVASGGRYQEDWQRRLRELRGLGWEYEYRRERKGRNRTVTFYRLKVSQPWPTVDLRKAIGSKKKRKRDSS